MGDILMEAMVTEACVNTAEVTENMEDTEITDTNRIMVEVMAMDIPLTDPWLWRRIQIVWQRIRRWIWRLRRSQIRRLWWLRRPQVWRLWWLRWSQIRRLR